jgi:hypothetical protein
MLSLGIHVGVIQRYFAHNVAKSLIPKKTLTDILRPFMRERRIILVMYQDADINVVVRTTYNGTNVATALEMIRHATLARTA